MTPRQKRMTMVAVLIAGVGVFITLLLMALNENINHFYGPKQVLAGEAPQDHSFRLGGLVVAGTVERDPNSLKITFDLTDTAESVKVQYEGILPDLFREGQGIVATGKMQGKIFLADEVLAKHDENYMPPEVADTLKEAGMTEHQGKKL
ncbi:MAG: cytochrome c maturation protein CcmE [Gammaproteobacteria bacterium]|nr:cytochrome c maturation protein CcmE [Gammaproteobacteria bacterium]